MLIRIKRGIVRRKYDNPPIHKVIFEIQFILKSPDPTIPGMFYDKIKKKYPDKHDGRGIYIKTKASEKGEFKNEVGLVQHVQFFKKDRSSSISLRSDMLTIKCSKYNEWGEFKKEIMEVLNYYKSIAEIKGIRSVLLRYINKINLDIPVSKLYNYFNYYPKIPNEYSKISESFQIHTRVPYNDNRLILILAKIPYEKNTIFYDIGYVLSTPERITIDKIQEWLEDAHEKIEDAFEAGITEECRKLFKVKENEHIHKQV